MDFATLPTYQHKLMTEYVDAHACRLRVILIAHLLHSSQLLILIIVGNRVKRTLEQLTQIGQNRKRLHDVQNKPIADTGIVSGATIVRTYLQNFQQRISARNFAKYVHIAAIDV